MDIFKRWIFIIYTIFSTSLLYSQNVITIRDDRVLLLNGKPFFPLGVYCEVINSWRHPDGYAELENSGFNLINLDWGTKALEPFSKGMISVESLPSLSYTNPVNAYRVLNDANDHNLFILADFMPFYQDATDFDGEYVIINQAFREQAVDNLVDWDIVENDHFLGWYSRDEPIWSVDAYRPGTAGYYCRSLVENRYYNMLKPTYDYVKTQDPDHIVFMNFCFAHDIRFYPDYYSYESARAQYTADILLYSGAADIIAHDIYPIWFWGGGESENPAHYSDVKYKLFENDEISLVGDYTKLLVESVNKPVFVVLEGYIKYNRSYANYNRLRFEAYHAIVNGATGLIWYGWFNESYNSNIWTWWKNLVHDEFSELTPNSLNKVLTARTSSLNLTVIETNIDAYSGESCHPFRMKVYHLVSSDISVQFTNIRWQFSTGIRFFLFSHRVSV